MSLFKKFTDFCAGIAAFAGGLFLLQEYMNFKPKEIPANQLQDTATYEASQISEEVTEVPGKLEQFFSPEYTNDVEYRLLFILVIALILSALIGRIFKRLPYVCFFFSLLPAVLTVYGFTENILYTQIGLFIIVCALHIAGNVIECILRDKEDGRHRLWVASKIASLFSAGLCFFFIMIADKIPTDDLSKRLPIFKDLVIDMTESQNIEIVSKLGWMFIIIFGIGLILYNVYFVDAIISTIPLGYSIYLLYAKSSVVELDTATYSEEILSFHPEIFVLLSAICFFTNLSLCVFENNMSRKEQLAINQNAKSSQEKNSEQPDKITE